MFLRSFIIEISYVEAWFTGKDFHSLETNDGASLRGAFRTLSNIGDGVFFAIRVWNSTIDVWQGPKHRCDSHTYPLSINLVHVQKSRYSVE